MSMYSRHSEQVLCPGFPIILWCCNPWWKHASWSDFRR